MSKLKLFRYLNTPASGDRRLTPRAWVAAARSRGGSGFVADGGAATRIGTCSGGARWS